ncbi:hypothetical protein GDO78_013678 [Eleutherodactylus coqui]|uniref:Uncharacterized protein n=1 Tax=Eleutherodactylus coqui TaxID=57060 RepID=A0A8J6EMG7_ELECQ|nr:hypothetical protein GDO78_013678 [Eleutherodactylus coqui]
MFCVRFYVICTFHVQRNFCAPFLPDFHRKFPSLSMRRGEICMLQVCSGFLVTSSGGFAADFLTVRTARPRRCWNSECRLQLRL